MKQPRRHVSILILPLVAGLGLVPVAAPLASGNPTASMIQSLTPAMIAALCGGGGAALGGAAGGAAGAAAGGAMSGLMAMLCSNRGVPLQALTSIAGQMMSGAGGSGGGNNGGGGSYIPPSQDNVSGLPVISITSNTGFNSTALNNTNSTNSLNYNTVGVTGGTTTQRLPDYGPLVPEVARRTTTQPTASLSYNRVGMTGTSALVGGGGVRLPNGQPARESGIRLGAFANGTQLASTGTGGINVGTSQEMVVGQQQIDWFTLGYDDGQNGRPKQVFQDSAEQYQYDSGYALGQQYPIQRPVV
ncbi:MAG: hypothetical protein INF43_01510 [Alphaproteobacteria bacterium]|nr:hypothetical protein [Alphaproteobacteria bacterium]